VTATTGDARVMQAIDSVSAQSYKNIQHLVVLDTPQVPADVKTAIRQQGVDMIELPYPTGKDRFNGHRIYGASTFLGKGDFFCFLDEDNWFDPDHIASLLDVIQRGFSWAFSLRKIVDANGVFICNDDCESLGKWPTILGDEDFLVDTNCYFLPRQIAIQSSPIWYRKFRDPGVQDADRALVAWLLKNTFNCDTSGRYSVNYRVGSTANSVQRDFFLEGNQRMLEKREGKLPWHHRLRAPPTPHVSVTWRIP
jgi:glycosyltransferase involved in cell wall biosynthesis